MLSKSYITKEGNNKTKTLAVLTIIQNLALKNLHLRNHRRMYSQIFITANKAPLSHVLVLEY